MKEAWIKALPKHKDVLLKNLEKAREVLENKKLQGWKQISPNKGKKTPLEVRKKQSFSAKKRGSVRQYLTFYCPKGQRFIRRLTQTNV